MSKSSKGNIKNIRHTMSKQDFYAYMKALDDVLKDYPINPDKYVRLFTVTINGKRRKIVTYQNDENGEKLRTIHRAIAAVMWNNYTPSEKSFAYKRSSSVVKALKEHITNDTFLKTDIHAYFESIDFKTLENKYLQCASPNGDRKTIWTGALKACFYEGHLPIGFVSSPVLSDLYLHDLDVKYGKIEGITYTRYADDLIISNSGKDAADKLAEIRDLLQRDIGQLGLELNKKKTYIRKLNQSGDAIHLLGLNMVKRESKENEITVSDGYIREVSKELCQLIADKSHLEDFEAKKRFVEVMGKIDYIKHVSQKSAAKLKKMIRIKSGIDTELTYKKLVKRCVNKPDTINEYITRNLNKTDKKGNKEGKKSRAIVVDELDLEDLSFHVEDDEDDESDLGISDFDDDELWDEFDSDYENDDLLDDEFDSDLDDEETDDSDDDELEIDDESQRAGYWDSVEIDIRVTEHDTAKRVEKLDFSKVGLDVTLKKVDDTSSENKNIMYYRLFETHVDDFIDDTEDETVGPFAAMRIINDALGMDGTAVTICKSVNTNNEVNECIVYYFLGDEIRTRDFLDVDTCYFYFNDFLEVLLDLPDEKIQTIHKEMFEEVKGGDGDSADKDKIERIINQGRNHLAYEIAAALGDPDLNNEKELITDVYDGPGVSALFDAVDEKRKNCVLDYDYLANKDFTPALKWEDEGITTFTKLEKYVMKKYYRTYQTKRNGVRIYRFPWQTGKECGEVELEISEWEYRRIRCAYWHGFSCPDGDGDLRAVSKRVREHLDYDVQESEQEIEVGYPKKIVEELETHALDNTYEYLIIRDGYIQITECWVNNREVTLPEKVDGYIVESIGRYAIFPRSMESLIIPGNVKHINFDAVSGYYNLKSVVLKEGVEVINANAFNDCKNLHEITLPKSIVNLGNHAFSRCDFRVVTTYLSQELMQSHGWKKTVRYPCFRSSYTSDKKVVVCGQLESIEEAMFAGMWDLKCLVLPEGIKTIGDRAFAGCSALTDVNIPDSVSVIAEKAFYGCQSLTTLMIPKSVREIAQDAFEGCNKLKMIAEDGTYAKTYAIRHGFSAESGRVGKKQQEISIRNRDYSEQEIQNLKTRYSKEASPPTFAIMKNENKGIDWSKIERYIKIVYSSTPAAWFRENDIVRDPVGTDVHNYMNEDFTRYIEKNGHHGEISVRGFLHYMEGVSYIYRVRPAASYEEITRDNGTWNLSEFESICRTYYKTTPAAFLRELGIISKREKKIETAESTPNTADNSTMILKPYRNTEIASYEYSDYSWAKSIEIPEGVREIKENAIWDAKITSVKLPRSLKKIGCQAFLGCENLSRVEIQEGLEEIGVDAFAGCPELTDIILPTSIKAVDSTAFRIDTHSTESRVTVHLSGNCAKDLVNKNNNSLKTIIAKDFVVDGDCYPTLEEYVRDCEMHRQTTNTHQIQNGKISSAGTGKLTEKERETRIEEVKKSWGLLGANATSSAKEEIRSISPKPQEIEKKPNPLQIEWETRVRQLGIDLNKAVYVKYFLFYYEDKSKSYVNSYLWSEEGKIGFFKTIQGFNENGYPLQFTMSPLKWNVVYVDVKDITGIRKRNGLCLIQFSDTDLAFAEKDFEKIKKVFEEASGVSRIKKRIEQLIMERESYKGLFAGSKKKKKQQEIDQLRVRLVKIHRKTD